MSAEMPNETNKRKLRLMMSEKEINRFCSIFSQFFFGLAFTPQIILMESCISANTLVAPTSRVITPITVAVTVLPLSEAFFIICCNCKMSFVNLLCKMNVPELKSVILLYRINYILSGVVVR